VGLLMALHPPGLHYLTHAQGVGPASYDYMFVLLRGCRDCSTGELRTVTDPTQRCTVRTTCAEPTLVNAPKAESKGNAASAVAPGFLLKALATIATICAMLVL
jgi:hypothetical protein